MKEFMEKLIASKKEEIENTRNLVKSSEDANEVRSLGETLDKLKAELDELENKLAELDKEEEKPADEEPANNEAASRSFNPLASYEMRGENKMENNNKELEYRLSFANYVTRGTKMEQRADANTVTSGVGSVIPENLVNEIISSIDNFGMILPLITKTSYAVGQTIPTDGTKPSASWVSEGASSDTQNKTTGSIVFSAFKLRCEISMSQEVTVQSLPAFEQLFIKQVGDAMGKAIETKVVSADDGSDCPTGILYTTGTDAAVEIASGSTGHFDYKALCDAEALLPQQYEGGAKWCMSKKTFMSIYSNVDSNGQPIGRINYGINGKPERVLLGRDVVLCPYLADYSEATASEDKTVAFLFDFSNYVLNTSYDLGIQSKQDWDTEDHRVKAVMSVDGKVIDRNSLVKVVKAYN